MASTQPPPIPLHLLPGYDAAVIDLLVRTRDGLEETEYASVMMFMDGLKEVTPWKLKDLTIKNWIKLARKVVTQKKSWKKFQDIM